MRIDLLAGIVHVAPVVIPRPPTILVFDSGLGGLTVLTALRAARPDARYVYVADDAGFPYGGLAEDALVARVGAVLERQIRQHAPDLVVIACNTASTLVLPHLRARFPIPFVGTVPAIKPAAALTRTGRFSVLATPGTVARDYTRELIRTYAGACRVNAIGSVRMAALAEAELCGQPAPDAEILAELALCFVEEGGSRTDVVVLGCTHYPLLLQRFQRLAPWPVTWIDPAPAVANRTSQLLGAPNPALRAEPSLAIFTDGAGVSPALTGALGRFGLPRIASEPMPLDIGMRRASLS